MQSGLNYLSSISLAQRTVHLLINFMKYVDFNLWACRSFFHILSRTEKGSWMNKHFHLLSRDSNKMIAEQFVIVVEIGNKKKKNNNNNEKKPINFQWTQKVHCSTLNSYMNFSWSHEQTQLYQIHFILHFLITEKLFVAAFFYWILISLEKYRFDSWFIYLRIYHTSAYFVANEKCVAGFFFRFQRTECT